MTTEIVVTGIEGSGKFRVETLDGQTQLNLPISSKEIEIFLDEAMGDDEFMRLNITTLDMQESATCVFGDIGVLVAVHVHNCMCKADEFGHHWDTRCIGSTAH